MGVNLKAVRRGEEMHSIIMPNANIFKLDECIIYNIMMLVVFVS